MAIDENDLISYVDHAGEFAQLKRARIGDLLALGTQWLGPYTLTPEIAGIIDPSDYGAEIGDEIAAGKLLSFFATGPGLNTVTDMSVGFGSSDSAVYVAQDRAVGSSAAGTEADNDFAASLALATPLLLTKVAGKVVVAFYPDSTPPASGSVDLYVKVESVATP